MPRTYYRRSYRNPVYGGYRQTTRRYPGIIRRRSLPIYRRTLRRRVGASLATIRRGVEQLAEKKKWDRSLSYTISAWKASPMTDLTAIPQGSSDSSRVGDKVTIRSLEARLRFTWFTSADLLIVQYRIILFQWLDDTTPTADDIIDNLTETESDLVHPFNHDKKVKRKILHEQMGSTTWAATTGLENLAPMFKIFIDFTKKKLSTRTVNYQAGGTVGVNKIYMLTLFTSDTNLCIFNMYTRINYIDT